jgi:hypothetical protein
VNWPLIVYIFYNAWIDGRHKFPSSRFAYKTSWRGKDGVHSALIPNDGLVWYMALKIGLNHSELHAVTFCAGVESLECSWCVVCSRRAGTVQHRSLTVFRC